MSSSHFSLIIIVIFALLFPMDSASDPEHRQEPILGGIQQRSTGENSAEIEELARFAVDEHNKKQNALLEFSRVLKAKEQTVAGIMHYLTVEAIEAGKKKIYEVFDIYSSLG
ncbi:cysteine proteinase inhibitor A-like [Asparagus officinalis]|uniref:cysteine proteinase inhibitor A-like n=1 Tax=Asparagus officinalis TaxID=4686 RepID=UPI00098E3EE9|nr:cysteine proteinase inhibitor A-like [Asparagus officinalis]